jgi:hypothetical protein
MLWSVHVLSLETGRSRVVTFKCSLAAVHNLVKTQSEVVHVHWDLVPRQIATSTSEHRFTPANGHNVPLQTPHLHGHP